MSLGLSPEGGLVFGLRPPGATLGPWVSHCTTICETCELQWKTFDLGIWAFGIRVSQRCFALASLFPACLCSSSVRGFMSSFNSCPEPCPFPVSMVCSTYCLDQWESRRGLCEGGGRGGKAFKPQGSIAATQSSRQQLLKCHGGASGFLSAWDARVARE